MMELLDSAKAQRVVVPRIAPATGGESLPARWWGKRAWGVVGGRDSGHTSKSQSQSKSIYY